MGFETKFKLAAQIGTRVMLTRWKSFKGLHLCTRGCIQKFPDWVDDDVYAYNTKPSL